MKYQVVRCIFLSEMEQLLYGAPVQPNGVLALEITLTTLPTWDNKMQLGSHFSSKGKEIVQ